MAPCCARNERTGGCGGGLQVPDRFVGHRLAPLPALPSRREPRHKPPFLPRLRRPRRPRRSDRRPQCGNARRQGAGPGGRALEATGSRPSTTKWRRGYHRYPGRHKSHQRQPSPGRRRTPPGQLAKLSSPRRVQERLKPGPAGLQAAAQTRRHHRTLLRHRGHRDHSATAATSPRRSQQCALCSS